MPIFAALGPAPADRRALAVAMGVRVIDKLEDGCYEISTGLPLLAGDLTAENVQITAHTITIPTVYFHFKVGDQRYTGKATDVTYTSDGTYHAGQEEMITPSKTIRHQGVIITQTRAFRRIYQRIVTSVDSDEKYVAYCGGSLSTPVSAAIALVDGRSATDWTPSSLGGWSDGPGATSLYAKYLADHRSTHPAQRYKINGESSPLASVEVGADTLPAVAAMPAATTSGDSVTLGGSTTPGDSVTLDGATTTTGALPAMEVSASVQPVSNPTFPLGFHPLLSSEGCVRRGVASQSNGDYDIAEETLPVTSTGGRTIAYGVHKRGSSISIDYQVTTFADGRSRHYYNYVRQADRTWTARLQLVIKGNKTTITHGLVVDGNSEQSYERMEFYENGQLTFSE